MGVHELRAYLGFHFLAEFSGASHVMNPPNSELLGATCLFHNKGDSRFQMSRSSKQLTTILIPDCDLVKRVPSVFVRLRTSGLRGEARGHRLREALSSKRSRPWTLRSCAGLPKKPELPKWVARSVSGHLGTQNLRFAPPA